MSVGQAGWKRAFCGHQQQVARFGGGSTQLNSTIWRRRKEQNKRRSRRSHASAAARAPKYSLKSQRATKQTQTTRLVSSRAGSDPEEAGRVMKPSAAVAGGVGAFRGGAFRAAAWEAMERGGAMCSFRKHPQSSAPTPSCPPHSPCLGYK